MTILWSSFSSSNFSTGTTVYQGDNRFSLKNIRFFQNKLELKKDNDFSLAFIIGEDKVLSYDAVLTAFQLQNAAASDVDYHELYKTYWRDNISPKVESLDPW